jgi:hypothetical protein
MLLFAGIEHSAENPHNSCYLKRIVLLMAIQPESFPGPQSLSRANVASARILVTEDPYVSGFLRAMLQRHGHEVVTCDAAEAGSRLHAGTLQVDVVITNQPEAFLLFAGAFAMLYMAANPDPSMALRFPGCRILHKPFRNDELLEAVEELAQHVIE